MPMLKIPEAAALSQAAGFAGESLVTALAIQLAEAGDQLPDHTWVINADAVSPPDADGGVDVGAWQIHLLAHPGVTVAQAKDPVFANAFAWKLSGGGKTWTAWLTWTQGTYQKFVAIVRAALAGPAPSPQPGLPDLLHARSLWLWQLDQCSERTIEQICDTAQNYAAATVVIMKAMDGSNFMGPSPRGDSSPEAISGYAKLTETMRRATAKGVTVIPFLNVTDPSQAAVHAALGPALVVDAEPYAQFFENGVITGNTVPDFERYLAGLRQGGVTQLYVSIDPRNFAATALGYPDWAKTVDAILPQFYWTDFQQAPDSFGMQGQIQAMAKLGTSVIPVLPANGKPGEINRFALACQMMQAVPAGWSLWRLGEADAAHLQEFAALPVQATPQPLPVPPPPPSPPSPQPAPVDWQKRAETDEWYLAVDELVGELIEIADQLQSCVDEADSAFLGKDLATAQAELGKVPALAQAISVKAGAVSAKMLEVND